MPDFWTGSHPVSYTHLHSDLVANGFALFLVAVLAGCAHIDIYIPDPVSYTHLDVYKRQVLAEGAGSEMFNGYYDNTDIYNKLADLLNIA